MVPLQVNGTGLLDARWHSCHPTISGKALKRTQSIDPNRGKSVAGPHYFLIHRLLVEEEIKFPFMPLQCIHFLQLERTIQLLPTTFLQTLQGQGHSPFSSILSILGPSYISLIFALLTLR